MQRGRITKAVTPDGTLTCAYDEAGHLLMDQRDGLGVVHEFDSGSARCYHLLRQVPGHLRN